MKRVSYLEILLLGTSHCLLACAITMWCTHASGYHEWVKKTDFWTSHGIFIALLGIGFMAYWGISYLRERKAGNKPSRYNKYFVIAYLISGILLCFFANPEMSFPSAIGKAIIYSLILSAIFSFFDYIGQDELERPDYDQKKVEDVHY